MTVAGTANVTEKSEPAPSRHGGDPVVGIGGLFGAEVNVDRAVGIDRGTGVAADRGKWLPVLQFRAAQGVVDDHRPEVLDRNVLWYVQPGVSWPVEVFTIGVAVRPQVLRALPDVFLSIIAGEFPAAM